MIILNIFKGSFVQFFLVPVLSIFIICTALVFTPSNLYFFENFSVIDFLAISLWGSSIWLFNRVIYKLYFRGVLVRKNGVHLPTLLENVIRVLIWFFSFLLFISIYFDYELTGLWATSSVTIAVLGFALRGMVMDIFSGISMGIERPFEIGDWIMTDNGIIGQVQEMNWRVTKIVTRENIVTILPNSMLAVGQLQNYGNGRYFRETVELELEYNITAHRAERILKSSANLIKEVQSSFKSPDTKILDFTPRGVKWELRFWLNNYEKRDDIVYEVQKNILRNLHFSGVEIPREKVDIVHSKNDNFERDDVVFMLKHIDFMECLQEEEFLFLSQVSTRHLFLENHEIIKFSQSGDSLFLLLEGTLSVHVPKENDNFIEVAKIKPGSFFGEMSLLTGALRSATVKADIDSIVYEIKQEHLKPILEKRVEILESLAEYIAQREERNKKEVLKTHLDDIVQEEKTKGGIEQLKRLFSIL